MLSATYLRHVGKVCLPPESFDKSSDFCEEQHTRPLWVLHILAPLCRRWGRHPWLSRKAGPLESGTQLHHPPAHPFPNGSGILVGAAWPTEAHCGRDFYNLSIWTGLLQAGLRPPYSPSEASLHSDGTEKRCLCERISHEHGTFPKGLVLLREENSGRVLISFPT